MSLPKTNRIKELEALEAAYRGAPKSGDNAHKPRTSKAQEFALQASDLRRQVDLVQKQAILDEKKGLIASRNGEDDLFEDVDEDSLEAVKLVGTSTLDSSTTRAISSARLTRQGDESSDANDDEDQQQYEDSRRRGDNRASTSANSTDGAAQNAPLFSERHRSAMGDAESALQRNKVSVLSALTVWTCAQVLIALTQEHAYSLWQAAVLAYALNVYGKRYQSRTAEVRRLFYILIVASFVIGVQNYVYVVHADNTGSSVTRELFVVTALSANITAMYFLIQRDRRLALYLARRAVIEQVVNQYSVVGDSDDTRGSSVVSYFESDEGAQNMSAEEQL